MTQKDIDREWAKMFLANWNKAVRLWDDGELFDNHSRYYNQFSREQSAKQLEYARICVSWFIPNNFNEPHMTAEGY